MFKDEVATKAIFLQAWGEIMHEYISNNGKVSLVLPKHLQEEAIAKQSEYLEEDPRIGLIQEYLDNHPDVDRVCALMLWRDALGHEYDEPQHRDINAIHDIMKNSITGWKSIGKQLIKGYGISRCYQRIAEFIDTGDEPIPFN
jgi:hypothetical protein